MSRVPDTDGFLRHSKDKCLSLVDVCDRPFSRTTETITYARSTAITRARARFREYRVTIFAIGVRTHVIMTVSNDRAPLRIRSAQGEYEGGFGSLTRREATRVGISSVSTGEKIPEFWPLPEPKKKLKMYHFFLWLFLRINKYWLSLIGKFLT